MFSDIEMFNDDPDIIVLESTDTEGDVKPKPIRRHPEFYFEDGSLVLLVRLPIYCVLTID